MSAAARTLILIKAGRRSQASDRHGSRRRDASPCFAAQATECKQIAMEETVTRFHGMTTVALMFGVMTVTAQATPLTNSAAGLKAAADDATVIEHVDACNRVCRKGPVEEWGGAVRWHRHIGNACRPIRCTP
jgi:hypothetical protein